MPNIAVVGAQWGDEGKGKIVDLLSDRFQVVARFQGGPNAGHTVIIDDQRYALHHIPSGVFRPAVKIVIGNGMVIDPWSLRDEIRALEDKGIAVRDRLFVSASAHVLMPFHKRLDELKESERKRKSIGTTGRGIGPAYLDKIQRIGLRMGDLLLPQENLERKAIELILSANEELSDERIHNLIFAPGFSTAEQISDVSGRGVGMDVVQRNIRDLGGNVSITSREGAGSTVTIRLPLTLAILDGQLARIGNETYIISLVSIVESLQMQSDQISTMSRPSGPIHFGDSFGW